MTYSKSSIVDISLLIALLVVFLMRPYFTWQIPEFVMAVVSAIVMIIAIINIQYKNNKSIGLLILLVFSYLLLSFHRGAHIGGLLVNLSFAFFPFMNEDLLLKVYEKFRLIIITIFCVSMVSYISALVGLQTPSEFIEPLNDLKQVQYAKYFFLVLPASLDDFARYCSIFDEPGVIGTMAALIMCVEGFSLKKKGNVIILLNGLLSLSLFFYLITGLYLLVKLPMKYKFVFIAGVLILYSATIDNDIISSFLWDRLVLNEDMTLSGDNRNSEDLIALWDKSKYNFQILWGYGQDYVKGYDDSASIQLFILRDGLIFVILYFIVYLLYAKLKIKSHKDIIIFALLMYLTLYQRPGFCNIEFTLLFVIYIIKKSKSYVGVSNRDNLQFV